MTRRHISQTKRLALFQKHGGICHLCGFKIHAERGEAWDISHDIPLELGGADDDENRKPAHRKCHRTHTATVDQPNIARAKRREAKHLGARPPSSFPTARTSRFKSKIGGGVVDRETGERVR